MLTDKEIFDAVNEAPLGRTGATTVVSVGRAIEAAVLAKPIDMVLHCPKCGAQHVDAPEQPTRTHADRGCGNCGGTGQTCDFPACLKLWTNPPHRSHKCHACGCIWRPADVPTNGVQAVATRGKADTYPTVKAAA